MILLIALTWMAIALCMIAAITCFVFALNALCGVSDE